MEWIVLAAAIALGVNAFAWFAQDRLIYFPQPLASTAHLPPGGWLLLEHGWDQAAAVRALLAQQGWAQVQSRADLAGIERCSGARRLPA